MLQKLLRCLVGCHLIIYPTGIKIKFIATKDIICLRILNGFGRLVLEKGACLTLVIKFYCILTRSDWFETLSKSDLTRNINVVFIMKQGLKPDIIK